MKRIDRGIGWASIHLALAVCLPLAIVAQRAPPDLTQASLEDLMNMQVTSVSKKEQTLSKAASAIYVITEDDIRRSGATNVPDLLRMVPGVYVARINSNAWAISIGGFSERYSGTVLVLVDGRSVYNPLFSGVYWDQQSMPLENIARIEVIRGASGSVWGANAMNGVINIITKSTKETQGALISTEAGSADRVQGLLQYGGTAGPKGSYRVYSRYALEAASPSVAAAPAVDGGHSSQIGFRSDWILSSRDKVTVQGDLFGASESQTLTTLISSRLPNYYTFDDKIRVGAGNILARWDRRFSDGSDLTVQTYFDRVRRFDQALNILTTGDFDLQYHFQVGARQDIVTGAGYRLTDQRFSDGYEVAVGTGQRRDSLFSTFIQDEVKLTNSLALTAGIKFEHNAYTGFEYEPSIQLAWSPGNRRTIWASASKAIQQPSWFYDEGQTNAGAVPVPGAGLAVLHVSGDPAAWAPRVFDYEFGYRAELSERLTLDATVFLADYGHLQTLETKTPFFTTNPGPPHLVLQSEFEDLGNARNYGVEASAHWNVEKWWRISPGLGFLRSNVSLDSQSNDQLLRTSPGNYPKRQAQLRSAIDLPHRMEWDTSVYFVDSLATGPVPAYTRLDTRFGWHLSSGAEISIAGQNLLTPRRIESLDGQTVLPTFVGRDIVAKITWRFQ